MWDALKNRSESLMHLKKAEGSRSSRCCRWCIQFTSPAVFLSRPLIGIDAPPNQGEHYRSAKVLEMTRFTERQSCISSVDFFYTDERFTESCSGKEEHAKQQHWKFQALSVYTVFFCCLWTMCLQCCVTNPIFRMATLPAEIFNGWSLNIIWGESSKLSLWQPLAHEIWKHGSNLKAAYASKWGFHVYWLKLN